MAVTTFRDPDNGIIKMTFSGTFELEELENQLANYFEGCPRGAHLFIVTDFTALEQEPESQDFTEALLGLCARCPKVPVLLAVVARGDMGYAPGRVIYPSASKLGLKMQIFKEQASATNWLLVGLE